MFSTAEPGAERFFKDSIETADVQVFPLAGDASSRRYYRIVSGDRSWVLMQWEPFVNDENYPFLSVREHFAKNGVQVPDVVGVAPEQGWVLLEDLGDLTLERKFWENQDQLQCLSYYQLAIDELVKMHFRSTENKGPCTAFKVAFDVEKLSWELNYGREHLLKSLCALKLSDKVNDELTQIFLKISEVLHQEPKFIAHRDYHSRNVMIKLGKARIIDFQDARMGPVQYDLVSLLRDSYVNLNDHMADELIKYYLGQARTYKSANVVTQMSSDHFKHIYEVQSVQRCFKACGSFASFYVLRGDTRYLKYLAPTLKRVESSLSRFKEFKLFYNLLKDNGIFDRDFAHEFQT